MVLAAQEHDTGWWDWEIKPQLNDERRPSDYIGSIKHLGLGVWLAFYRNGITRLAEQDAYAGYIVSLHAEALLTQGKGLLSYMPDYTVHAHERGQKATPTVRPERSVAKSKDAHSRR